MKLKGMFVLIGLVLVGLTSCCVSKEKAVTEEQAIIENDGTHFTKRVCTNFVVYEQGEPVRWDIIFYPNGDVEKRSAGFSGGSSYKIDTITSNYIRAWSFTFYPGNVVYTDDGVRGDWRYC